MRLLKRIVLGLLLLVGTAAFFGLAVTIYADTRSELSIYVFRIGYKIYPDTKTYLHFYSPRRRDVSAGYIPPEVDTFLCGRAEATSNEDEFDAIVDFYSLQAGGREGDCIFRTSERVREKIASRLVAVAETDGQLVLLEEMRRGKSLGKGHLGRGPTSPESGPLTPDEWEAWYKEALPFAWSKYTEWWKADTNWEEKKRIDPLAGMHVRVNECCG